MTLTAHVVRVDGKDLAYALLEFQKVTVGGLVS